MENIGIGNLPNLSYRQQLVSVANINVLIVGSRGIGKTKFIENLLKKKMSNKTESMYFDIETFEVSDQKNLTKCVAFKEYKTRVFEKDSRTSFNIIEGNNIGDSVNNKDCIIPIVNFIKKRQCDYFGQEKNQVPDLINDKRIHLMLYLFDSSCPKAVDLQFLMEMPKHVNFVPCCARSDGLMDIERQIIKKSNIYNRIKFYSPSIEFVDNRNNKTNVLESLLKENILDLKAKTEKFYSDYKRKRVILNLIEDLGEGDKDSKFLNDFLCGDVAL